MIITYKVSELVNNIKVTLEENFALFEVIGEVSEVNFHSKSGHVYFKIKDDKSYLSCVLWKSLALRYRQFLQEGKEVKIKGRVSSFLKTASIQVLVLNVSFSKDGDIKKHLEELTTKLTKEGLFSVEHKKHITRFPQEIGIITSKDGAVLGDIRQTLKNRYPCKIKLYSALVQGGESINNVIDGIKWFNKNSNVSFIIIARGGGSADDLFHFNDEQLVRAIFNSKIPIITAIGHEINSCLADRVADLSVVTPTASVGHIPLKNDLIQELNQSFIAITKMLRFLISSYFERLNHIVNYITTPKNRIDTIRTQVIDAYEIIKTKMDSILNSKRSNIQYLLQNTDNKFLNTVNTKKEEINYLIKGISVLTNNKINQTKKDLEYLNNTIEGLSIKSTLRRGFALVYQDNHIVKFAGDINKGKLGKIEFFDGNVDIDIK